MKMEQSVPKRRNIKFRRRGITQKEAYNIQNTVKIWNQEPVIAWLDTPTLITKLMTQPNVFGFLAFVCLHVKHALKVRY